MTIRAFLSVWTVSAYVQGQRFVSNPIQEYIEENNIDAVCMQYYPDADADGLPDKNRVFVLVKSETLTGEQIENAKNLLGVSLIPAYPLDTVLEDIPIAVRNTMLDIVNNNGIPTDGITLQSLYVDVINLIITFFIPDFPGLTGFISGDFG